MSRRDYLDPEDAHQNVAHRVIITKTKDDGDQQKLSYKGLHGEEHTDVVRVQHFGLSTHVPVDSEAVVLALGDRDMPVVLGAESPKHRPTDLPEGATMLYDQNGSKVYLDAGGGVNVECSGTLTLKAGTIKIIGNIEHEGDNTQSGVHTDSIGTHAA
ncbi:phage baseplate assembly protein [uncultured Hyphomicrobium sp.]|uniref:phage baseplate assembly protein domain-containing protein n=1 Tax=uncultured Hyphomicrobium sp. TaxID=194373 RepID=UPI0025E88EA1|nr:phage baseplate assembly protein [uncultured Hyphomicrobium sp.]